MQRTNVSQFVLVHLHNEGGEFHLNHHHIHLITDFRNVFHTLILCVHTICTHSHRHGLTRARQHAHVCDECIAIAK